MFIDASYEGDLMPGAGVSYVMGRESNKEFDEQGNGNTGVAKKNQLRNGIDPYVVKGAPSSGLLPGGNPGLGGEKGEGDHRFQAYCYRMCLTDVPENARIMNEEPFGPVAVMLRFKDEDEMMERANKLPFGLASYAFTHDSKRAARIADDIEAGMLSINHHGLAVPETPFGGIKDSGYGHEQSTEGLLSYMSNMFVTQMGLCLDLNWRPN